MVCECGNDLRKYFHHHPKNIKRYICHECDNRYEEKDGNLYLMDAIEVNLLELKAFKKLIKENGLT